MSYPVQNWVWEDPDARHGTDGRKLGGSEHHVLAALATFADRHTGQCFPGVKKLAEVTCLSERTVRDALRRLEAAGRVVTERGGPQEGKPSIYTLIGDFNPYFPPAKSAGVDEAQPRQDLPRPRQKSSQTPAKSAPEPITEPVKEPGKGEGGKTPPSSPPAGQLKSDEAANRAKVARTAADDWNGICGPAGLMQVVNLTDARIKATWQRLCEDFGQDQDRWRTYLRRVVASPFLRGDNPRGWRADFDWCLKPTNVAKVIEGNYDPRPGSGAYDGNSPRSCL